MTQPDVADTQAEPARDQDASAPVAAGSHTPDGVGAAQPPALGDTAGTGTIIAFGCIGATVFLIVVGIVIILLLQVF